MKWLSVTALITISEMHEGYGSQRDG